MFCSRCGHEVGETDSYCPACGLALSPATIASSPPILVDDPGQRTRDTAYDGGGDALDLVEGPAGAGGDKPVRRRPRRVALAGIGVMLVALVGAGAWFAAGDRGSGTVFYSSYGDSPLNDPVTSQPEERWRVDVPSDGGTWVVSGGDVTFISTQGTNGATTIRAIEDDGEERWSVEAEADTYPATTSDDGSVLLVLPWAYDESSTRRVQALSAEDGTLLWSGEGEPGRFTDDGLVLVRDSEVTMVDIRDGTEVWSLARGDGLGANSDLVLALDNGTLTAHDIDTGEVRWDTDRELPCVGGSRCVIAASDEVVLVKGGIDLVAYDANNGDLLWKERVDETAEIGAANAELVFARDAIDSESNNAGSAVFYDSVGERGEVALPAEEPWFFPVGLDTADGSFLLDWGSGTVYDDEIRKVDQIDGDLTMTGGGVYALDGDTVSYHRFDQRDPVWTLAFGTAPNAVTAGDRSLVLSWEDAIALYR